MSKPTSSSVPPTQSLSKFVARVLDQSDQLGHAAEMLAASSAGGAVRASQKSALRSHAALERTQAMLEESATSLQRAKRVFAPLGLTASPW